MRLRKFRCLVCFILGFPEFGAMMAELEEEELLGNCEELHKTYSVQGREPALINPADAKRNGIADGDVVELYNDRGAVLCGAIVTDKIREGVVSLQSGSWSARDSKGRCNSGQINFITSSQPSTGLTQAGAANTCVSYIRKCEDVEGPNKMFEAPPIIEHV